MTWTTELANAEAAETRYRQARRFGPPSYLRWNGRGAQLLLDWIRARAAVSTAAPGSDPPGGAIEKFQAFD